MSPQVQDELDRKKLKVQDDLLDQAIREVDAQRIILEAMVGLTPDARVRVLQAMGHLVEAETLVPGVLRAVVARA